MEGENEPDSIFNHLYYDDHLGYRSDLQDFAGEEEIIRTPDQAVCSYDRTDPGVSVQRVEQELFREFILQFRLFCRRDYRIALYEYLCQEAVPVQHGNQQAGEVCHQLFRGVGTSGCASAFAECSDPRIVQRQRICDALRVYAAVCRTLGVSSDAALQCAPFPELLSGFAHSGNPGLQEPDEPEGIQKQVPGAGGRHCGGRIAQRRVPLCAGHAYF